MKSKISICFLTIVVILLALVMIEKINTQRAADKAAIIAQSNENDKEEKNEKESLMRLRMQNTASKMTPECCLYTTPLQVKNTLTQACILKNCQMKQKIRLQTDSTFLTKLICTIFLKAIQVNVKINQLGERICTM